jgi:hypothetical protein
MSAGDQDPGAPGAGEAGDVADPGGSGAASGEAELATLIEAYLDGTLLDTQAERLVARIRTDADAARRLRAAVAMAGLVVQALDQASAEDVARAVDVRLQAEQDASAFVRTVDQALPSRASRAARWLLIPAAAALVALALLLTGLRGSQGSQPSAAAVASFRPRAGGDAAQPSDGSQLLFPDGHVQLGPGEQGTLAFADEPTVFTLTGADLRILHGAPGIHCDLTQGELAAAVAHQQPGTALTIDTPHGSVAVVGTHLRVTTDARGTSVAVLDGAVELRSRQGATTRIDAGASVRLPEDPAAREDQPPPAGALPPAPDWSPLFPATGPAGWLQVGGSWTCQDGAVVGSAPADGWTRLVSSRDLGDFAMTCRLRILGVNYAEVQLLDYKWFVPVIPDQPETWQSVAVQVRAGVVSAWCAGKPVDAHPGMDSPRLRFGPLAFYMRAGGRLEIRDARFRESAQPLETSP